MKRFGKVIRRIGTAAVLWMAAFSAFGQYGGFYNTPARPADVITSIPVPVAQGGTGITSFGTGVATALGVNVGSAGSFVTFNGALGTPSSGTLTNATGLPIAGITGLGTGVGTALAVNTGSAGAPVLFNGALGTPSSGTLTSATGLPISTGLTGAGTGVLTALGVNVGSAGSFVTFNGALGTPSSITLTNGTGLPLTGLASQAANTVTANATSGSAAPTAHAAPSCSAAGSALKWTTNTGLGCNTAIDAATLGSATFAAPGAIGSGTAATSVTSTTFLTTSGSTGSIATATATTILAAGPGLAARYEVAAVINSVNVAIYSAYATVVCDGSSCRIVANNGAGLTLTLSGNNIQTTQTTGGNATVNYVITRLGA